MCLASISMRLEANNEVKAAWKVFVQKANGWDFLYYCGNVPLSEDWYRANERSLQINHNDSYISGFHVFPNYSDAKLYAFELAENSYNRYDDYDTIVLPVAVKGVHTVGVQEFRGRKLLVWVARYMQVPVREQKPITETAVEQTLPHGN